MAKPAFTVSLNAYGLQEYGLFKVVATFPAPPPIPIIDGLGLLTFGFVWNDNQNWTSCFIQNSVVWSGCSACSSC